MKITLMSRSPGLMMIALLLSAQTHQETFMALVWSLAKLAIDLSANLNTYITNL